MNRQRNVSSNNNTNNILQIDYNRLVKIIEETSENISAKISTVETTLKRKIEGISCNQIQPIKIYMMKLAQKFKKLTKILQI
jgi:hypothetical protein